MRKRSPNSGTEEKNGHLTKVKGKNVHPAKVIGEKRPPNSGKEKKNGH